VGEECTQEVADLIDICMRTNVEERPSAKEVVARLQVRFAPMPDIVLSCQRACILEASQRLAQGFALLIPLHIYA